MNNDLVQNIVDIFGNKQIYYNRDCRKKNKTL